MKIRYRKVIAYITALAIIVTSAPAVSVNAKSSKMKLSTNMLATYIGYKSVIRLKGAKKKVTWRVTNKKIVSITVKGKKSQKCVVTSKRAGRCTLVAKCAGKKYKCRVVVSKFSNSTAQSTKKPITTKSPVTVTRNPTVSPDVTRKPVMSPSVTKSPIVSMKPGTTTAPSTVQSPGVSQTPSVTEGSQVTSNPLVTKKPLELTQVNLFISTKQEDFPEFTPSKSGVGTFLYGQDLSDAQDRSIIKYVYLAPKTKKYFIFIKSFDDNSEICQKWSTDKFIYDFEGSSSNTVYVEFVNTVNAGASISGFFGGLGKYEPAELVGLDNLDTSKTEDFSYLFAYCGIKSLDLNDLNTSHARDVSGMFFAYRFHKISGTVNMSNVDDCSWMFSEAAVDSDWDTNGTKAFIEGLDVSNCQKYNAMFSLAFLNTDVDFDLDLSKYRFTPCDGEYDFSSMFYSVGDGLAQSIKIKFPADVLSRKDSVVIHCNHMFYNDGDAKMTIEINDLFDNASVGDDTQFVNDEDSLCIPTFIFTSKESRSNFLKKFSGFTSFFETSVGV